MHIFNLRRTKSIANKNNNKHPDSAPSSATSSRLPLVPQTNIGVQSTPSVSSALPSDHASSSNPISTHSSSPTKRVLGSKISHRDVVDDRSKTVHLISPSSIETQVYQGLTTPPPRSPRAVKPNYSELYTQNDLSTFSFGAAPSTASSSSAQPPVDPLTRLPEDDEISITPSLLQDTTPRPSVVGNQHPLTQNSQYSTQKDWETSIRAMPQSRGGAAAGKAKAQDSDTASSHTFGTSSASASVSSLSRPRGGDSRAASRTSGYSSTTPQTSANDLTSDEDDDMIGRHPIPPEPRPPGPAIRYTSPDRESSIYLSEEEFEGDGYGEEYEPDIEIESAVPDNSDRGTIDYSNASRESFVPLPSERRGSAAMAIPKKQSDNAYHDSFPDNRAWDYDFSKDRRGSKSMVERSFMQSGESSSFQRSLPPAPISVPESEGDWQNLRKRSMTAHREKDLPPIAPSDSSSMEVSSTPPSLTNSSTEAGSSVSEAPNWIQGFSVNGVVALDSSEMQDIFGEPNLNIRFLRKGSTNSAARRTSTVSSTDIIHKNITTSWANENDREQTSKWSSRKVKEGVEDQAGRRHNGNERDRPSIANLFPRASTSANPDFFPGGSSATLDKSDSKYKDKEKDKSTTTKTKWTGMAIDSEETWFNFHLGRHKVQRKNAPPTEPGKSHQQRLHAQHLRSPTGPNGTGREQPDGPNVTIHKHSKAAAFSISRNHRKPSSNNGQANGQTRHASSSNGQMSSKDSTENSRKKSNMILLATRRVQKAYTSTNTTRKLDTHGLLDDNGAASPPHAEGSRKETERDHDRHRSSRTKDKETRTKDKESRSKDKESRSKDKERKDKEREKDKNRVGEASSSRRTGQKSEVKSKVVVAAELPLPDSSEGSSAGSVSYAISSGDSGTMVDSSTGTTPEHSEVTNSVGSTGSIEHSIRSQETASSDRTISRNVYNKSHSKPRRRGHYDSGDDVNEDDEDDSSDGIPGITRYPTRTPHRETYAALPPEVFENAHQEHSSSGIFGWGRSKGSDRNGLRANQYLDASYKPPWPVTQPRTNSETRKGIVDDLNTSFQDVGLLPATGEIKGSSNHGGQNRRKRDQHPKKSSKRSADSKDQTQRDIFESVPDEALYMLLPLWPGETDSYSARKYPWSPPTISTHSRQYLLIYYKTYESPPTIPEETSKSRSGEKKRSQEAAETANDKSVLLQTFHITAQVFSYRDLQGSGVRIPDVGLAVCGPLEEAFDSIPVCQRKDNFVIGICHSRESGIEFVPEGFDEIGLCKLIPNPRTLERSELSSEEEDSGSFDAMRILTPIGRAVMEMAWLGGLAVSSFNPNH